MYSLLSHIWKFGNNCPLDFEGMVSLILFGVAGERSETTVILLSFVYISSNHPPPPPPPQNIGSLLCPVFWNSSDSLVWVSFHQLSWILRGLLAVKSCPFTYWLFSCNILDFFVIVTVLSGTPIDSSIFEKIFTIFFISFSNFWEVSLIFYNNSSEWGGACFILVLFLKCLAWLAERCMIWPWPYFPASFCFLQSLFQSQWLSRVLNSHVPSCWRTFAHSVEFVHISLYLLNSYLFFSL